MGGLEEWLSGDRLRLRGRHPVVPDTAGNGAATIHGAPGPAGQGFDRRSPPFHLLPGWTRRASLANVARLRPGMREFERNKRIPSCWPCCPGRPPGRPSVAPKYDRRTAGVPDRATKRLLISHTSASARCILPLPCRHARARCAQKPRAWSLGVTRIEKPVACRQSYCSSNPAQSGPESPSMSVTP